MDGGLDGETDDRRRRRRVDPGSRKTDGWTGRRVEWVCAPARVRLHLTIVRHNSPALAEWKRRLVYATTFSLISKSDPGPRSRAQAGGQEKTTEAYRFRKSPKPF